MAVYLEHANITVPDIDAAIDFLKIIEPTFKVRHDETSEDGYRWAHIGTDDYYIALQKPYKDSQSPGSRRPYRDFGINHLGWVVEDFDAVIQRLEEKGCRQGLPVESHPFRKRAYYFDSAGFEWEIIEYLSNDPAEKNSYD
jgi:catechol 2,3-dioxygenase-like lactoylglutathione lyase family enzyme